MKRTVNAVDSFNIGEHVWQKHFKMKFSVLGLLFNVLLLFLIIRHSKPHLGNYRHLLKIFAINDILMVALHAIVEPVCAFPCLDVILLL